MLRTSQMQIPYFPLCKKCSVYVTNTNSYEIYIRHFFIIILVSCDKVEVGTELPICIADIIADEQRSVVLKTVKVQEVNGELHYRLNTNASGCDKIEYIVINTCDTICSLGGGRGVQPLLCLSQYEDSKWQTIWEK